MSSSLDWKAPASHFKDYSDGNVENKGEMKKVERLIRSVSCYSLGKSWWVVLVPEASRFGIIISN